MFDIHKIGIAPDVDIEFDAQKYRDSEGQEDNQIDAAVDEILKKLGKSKTDDTVVNEDTNANESVPDTDAGVE